MNIVFVGKEDLSEEGESNYFEDKKKVSNFKEIPQEFWKYIFTPLENVLISSGTCNFLPSLSLHIFVRIVVKLECLWKEKDKIKAFIKLCSNF